MLAPEFIPVWGGVGTYIVDLVKHLSVNNEVHVLTPLRSEKGGKVSSLNFDFANYFGSNVHMHFVCKANDTFFYNAKFQYACARQVPKLIKEEKIDVIHSHTAHMPDLLLTFRDLDAPTVTTVHTTILSQRMGTRSSKRKFLELERSEKATYLLYPFLRLSEKAYFKKARLYISPSEWMKNSLEKNFHVGENIRVIPHSIDIADYKMLQQGSDAVVRQLEGLLPDSKIVLYVGRLLAMKGVDVLLEAIPQVLERTQSEKLLFVFAGPGDRVRYMQKAKELNVEKYCLFTGPLAKPEVISLMGFARMVVAPSFTENMPYTVLESMASGVPVVANNVGGVSEIITDGYDGRLLASNTPSEIADAIVKLLEDESLRCDMAYYAKATIHRRFSWKTNLEKYLDVYSKAINDDGLVKVHAPSLN
jgi:glycosyltransferase involved in cell wall biosynthesis